MSARILRGDVLAFARHYRGPRFHALLCDPPYHLTSIVKRFGSNGSKPAKHGKDGAFTRASAGFMGKKWDGGDIAFRPETWAALAVLLHPGAFVIAFSGSRGWHRQAVAMEDAGLIIHPMLGWLYGSGFPKATRIDTQIDKAAGVERVIIPDPYAKNHPTPDIDGYSGNMHSGNHTAPATPLARAWAGHRYGMQALKPALEPIIVAQVPYDGKPVDSITRTGAGAFNVDGARIRFENDAAGRWPANFALSHLPECVRVGERRVKGIEGGGQARRKTEEQWRFNNHKRTGYADADGLESIAAYDCAPGCPVAMLGEQSGDLKGNSGIHGTYKGGRNGGAYADPSRTHDRLYNFDGYADSGTAARFFHNSDWNAEAEERIASADPVRYQAKAARRERDAGLEGMPRKFAPTMGDGIGAREHNPDAPGALVRNPHPTVKPIALTRWLATLLLPPAEYAPRRLFVPFAGAGSEMIGAGLAGWEEIVGVEGEAEYVDIARARLAYWLAEVQPELDLE